MKKQIIIVLCIMAFQANAIDRPESIPSKLREVKASSWYLEKFRSWTTYLADHPEDKSGWLECFKAALYSGMPGVEVEKIVDRIEQNFTGSPEAYWTKAKLYGWTSKGSENLEKALVNAKKDDWITDQIMLAEFKGTDRSAFTERLHHSNLIFPSLLNYSYNVLMSVGENGFLITEGENTTIPIWILQDVMGIRKDVGVLNLDLLEHPGYRERKLSELSLRIDQDDISSLPMLNPDREFYFALTLPRQNTEMLEDRLYVVGLTSFLSSKEVDNYQLVKENIEEKFLLDYLTVDFNGEPKTATGRTFEPNYIVPFYVLKQYYDKTNSEESAYWEGLIREIAERSQIGGRVELLLSRSNAPREFVVVEMELKKLDKELTKVKDNIYARSVEVTNKDYTLFLKYLKEQGYDELFEKANFDLSGYDPIKKAFSEAYHFNNDTKKMNYADYPVMDITHEAAKLYCEWLTTQYNGQSSRKFRKVKFRLPSRQEWTMAALGYVDFQTWVFEDNIVKARPDGDNKPKYFEKFRVGDYDSVSYPWYHSDWYKYRNSIRNEHGCYLANVKTPNEKVCPAGIIGDGFAITSPAATYFSNDMGLFDVIGNVAEMINEPGKAMGGSWNHPPEESTITSVYSFDDRDMSVGFRIFMEVIEE